MKLCKHYGDCRSSTFDFYFENTCNCLVTLRDWDSRLSYFPWQTFYICFMNSLCSMTICFLFKNKHCLDWIFFRWPPKSRNFDCLIHKLADEYSFMHAMSHFNGGHLKPSKQLWIITCKFSHCLGTRLLVCLFCSAYVYFSGNYETRTVYQITGHFTLRFASETAPIFVPDDRLWGWTINDRLPFSHR